MWRRGGDIHWALSPGKLVEPVSPDILSAFREPEFARGMRTPVHLETIKVSRSFRPTEPFAVAILNGRFTSTPAANSRYAFRLTAP
jgi:hypothetical protein